MSKPKKEAKQEVFKHSAAIHIHNNITLLQRRTWNALLFHAYNAMETEEVHRIALLELAKLVGYDSRNHSGPKKLQNRVHAVYAPSHEFSSAH